jgi:polyisoprenoid-binding protein YceI
VLLLGSTRKDPHLNEMPDPSPAASDAHPPPGSYELDPPHTFVVWSAKHEIVGTVRGRFDKIAGTLGVARDPAACTVDVSSTDREAS